MLLPSKLWYAYIRLGTALKGDAEEIPSVLPQKDKEFVLTKFWGVSYLDLYHMLDKVIKAREPMERKIGDYRRALYVLGLELEDKETLNKSELETVKEAIHEILDRDLETVHND